jgi:hypothetical protein
MERRLYGEISYLAAVAKLKSVVKDRDVSKVTKN